MNKNSIYTEEFESLGENPWEGGARSRRLPRGEDLGASLYVLVPGATTGYYHFHHGIEEMLLLIEGRPKLRTPEGERILELGEVVHFRKGPEGSHQIINDTEETVRLVMVSNQASPDAVEYPDQKMLSVMARTNSQLGEPLWDIRRIDDNKSE
ncbi:MAG TPA: cupin domain-containing protein [Proteiniclasticum sp.]|nr:cupin domain-containing protein [Proteiniclasticum sp.]